ncbi:hypothetical protein PISMIDRAFT_268281 [Pisolithus microcarpus 441]|uniref:Uncharacterized protein n=1 Tax=Pisolithus microcarpus 441 TaxID=765257 RepID=A0A0C9XV93_9AGAM|nr:hypothetical protein PISMIDRAFT_268281 [Pisolithus microcarpus 441]
MARVPFNSHSILVRKLPQSSDDAVADIDTRVQENILLRNGNGGGVACTSCCDLGSIASVKQEIQITPSNGGRTSTPY